YRHRPDRGSGEAMVMTGAQLRAKIRQLIARGGLPSEAAPIQRPVPPAPTGPKPHMFVADSLLDQPCTICGELAPQAQLFYAGGIVVRVHAACNALWQQ